MSETTFKIKIPHYQLKEEFAKTASSDEWIEMYDSISKLYSCWTFDLKVAEHILKKIKEEYINSNTSLNEIPKILIPLLSDKIKNDFILENKRNDEIKREECGCESEYEAIKALRKIETLNYNTVLNLYCDAYELSRNKIKNKDLSDYSSKELLKELNSRL